MDNNSYDSQDIMNELAATYIGGVNLVEAIAGTELDVDITDFDPGNDMEILMAGVDSMMPDDAPTVQAEFDE